MEFCIPALHDSITPQSRFTNHGDVGYNLALSCQGCNNHKFTRTRAVDPVTELTVALYHPRQQAWREHFAWLPDARRLVGLSPTGRATVEMLRLNRPGLMGLREALIAIGMHPPFEL